MGPVSHAPSDPPVVSPGADLPEGELAGTRSGSLPTPRAEAAERRVEWLTVDEFAAEARLDRKTVYAAIKAKSLPGVLRLGNKTLRICRTALVASLAGQPGGSLKGKE
jgi:Helix-turn-helix domain